MTERSFLASLGFASLVLGSCADSRLVGADGGTAFDGAVLDAGVDSYVPPCTPAGEVTRLPLDFEARTDSRPLLLVHRALRDADGTARVLVEEEGLVASTEGLVSAPVYTVLSVASGALASRVGLVDDAGVSPMSVDFVRQGEGGIAVGVFGAAREDAELWSAWVPLEVGGRPVVRRVHGSASREATESLTAVARGTAVDVFRAERSAGGVSLVRRVLEDAELGEPTIVANLGEDARYTLTSKHEGDSSCVVARGYPSGLLQTFRFEGATLAETRTVGRGSFLPMPEVIDGECVVAFFEADERFPTRGRVRVVGASGELVGWGGTEPLGIALLSDAHAVALLVSSPDWPGRVDLHVVELGDARCAVPPTEIAFEDVTARGFLGSLVAAQNDEGAVLFVEGESSLRAAHYSP